jgi:hypothetical protein
MIHSAPESAPGIELSLRTEGFEPARKKEKQIENNLLLIEICNL